MSMKRFVIALAVALFITAFASPASAERGDRDVRFGVLMQVPTGDFTEDGQTTELDSSVGFQASFEYGITKMMGVEAGFSSLSHDVKVKESGFPALDLGKMDLLTITVSLNFHVKRTDDMDLFVGPTIGNAFWGDLRFTDPAFDDFPTDDKFFFGLNAGVDIPFGKGGWAFNGRMSYSFLDASLVGGPNLGVDPVGLGVGLSYGF